MIEGSGFRRPKNTWIRIRIRIRIRNTGITVAVQDDEEEGGGETGRLDLPTTSCAYCGIHDPSTLLNCNICKRNASHYTLLPFSIQILLVVLVFEYRFHRLNLQVNLQFIWASCHVMSTAVPTHWLKPDALTTRIDLIQGYWSVSANDLNFVQAGSLIKSSFHSFFIYESSASWN